MKTRIEKNKPLNLNDQINAIEKGLLPAPVIGTPTTAITKRSKKFSKGRIPTPAEYVQLWPTPTAYDWNTPVKSRIQPGSDTYRHNLKEAVLLWPTPRAGNPGSRPNGKGGKVLSEEVKKLWATPTANDAKNSLTESQIGRGTLTAHIVETENTNSGQLNADWVEALMGYPLFWTDIQKQSVVDIDYPAVWVNGSWENGIARTITNQKNRIKRLKCLGNAIVPEIAEIIFILIKQFLEVEYAG